MKNKAMAITAFLLVVAVLLLSACSGKEDKIIGRATNYLVEKYGDLGFEILNYTQNKTTNGRFTLNVYCEETDTVFKMFMYSLRITDGYSVAYSNDMMQKKIMEGPLENLSENVSSVQWKNEFEDGLEDFTYRTMEMREYSISEDLESLYLVQLEDCPHISNAARIIYNVIISFEPYGALLSDTTFVFEIGSYSYTVKADYATATELRGDGFVKKVYELDSEAKSKSISSIISIDMTAKTEE